VADPPIDRDRLRRLTERLDVAAQRAEQLLSESVLAAATGQQPEQPVPGPEAAEPQRPPPSGWRGPPLHDRSDRDRWLNADELDLLMAVLAAVRDRIPAELRRRLADAVRELLMALRALLDWYLERTDRPARTRTDVEDIPIL
jgi:hypothetical protein